MTDTGTIKVLLMDDDEIVRETSSLMLEHLGHKVTTAQEGKEAILLYLKAKDECNPYDLVMIDIMISGGMGGIETIKTIHSQAPDANFIIASGYTDNISISDLKKYGVNGFLRKPYTIPDLNKIISEAIKSKPGYVSTNN